MAVYPRILDEPIAFRPSLRDERQKPIRFPTTTVEVECVVVDDARPSYLVGGKRQAAGDRARLPLADAKSLAIVGKARIIPGSEKEDLL